MKALIFAVALVLAGCSTTVPVKQKFPEAPPVLLEPAEQLKTIDPNDPRLSKLLETSVENMGSYHILLEKYRAWQEWYREQKKIFDSAK